MKTKVRLIIKEEIEKVFGRKVVSSRDCIELSDEILLKTSERLNQNTLRRFFGLVKSEYPPSQATLTILSKYCGFQSLDEAYQVRSSNQEAEKSVSTESVLHYLISMFKDMNMRNVHDEAFLLLAKNTIQFIASSDTLADRFQSQIVRTTNGSRIYFEHLVNVDCLNSYYGSALRYYLKEKATPQAEAFANSIYAIRHWLNGDDDKLENIVLTLTAYKNMELCGPVMYEKLYMAKLLYADVFKASSNSEKTEIKNYYHTLADQDFISTEDMHRYCYSISEAFALTGQYEEALYYMERAPKIKVGKVNDQSVYYYQSMNLLHCYSLYKLGATQEAERILDSIKQAEFNFLRRKMCSIIYLYLLRELKHNGKKYQEQLTSLIEETGFLRLKTVLQ